MKKTIKDILSNYLHNPADGLRIGLKSMEKQYAESTESLGRLAMAIELTRKKIKDIEDTLDASTT